MWTSTSFAIVGLSRPLQTHTFRQLFGCDGESRFISAWVCEQPQTVEEAQGLEYGSIDANTHGVITRFNAPKRRAAGKGSFGDDSGRQTATAPGIADIQPHLAEGPPYGD
jgi:hypothetical protein